MDVVRMRSIQVHLWRHRLGAHAEFLLLQRSAEERVYPNVWQVITGTIEVGETAYDAARREVFEETGVRVSTVTAVPYVGSFYDPSEDAIQMIPVFAARVTEKEEIVLSREHQAAVWMSYDNAYDRLVMPSHRDGMKVLCEYMIQPGHQRIGTSDS